MKKLIIILPIIVLAGLFGAKMVGATSSFFLPVSATASATSTVSYLTAGTGTTTLAMDSFQNGIPRLIDRAALLVQFAGSSTASILNINLEFSDDNIDWYQDGGNFTSGFATSSRPVDIGQVSKFNYTFSSTTPGLGAAINATSTRIITTTVPTRYVRAVFTIPVGSLAGAVWAKWVPSRQSQN